MSYGLLHMHIYIHANTHAHIYTCKHTCTYVYTLTCIIILCELLNHSVICFQGWHLQWLNETPLACRILIELAGGICSVHCSCMADLGETCTFSQQFQNSHTTDNFAAQFICKH